MVDFEEPPVEVAHARSPRGEVVLRRRPGHPGTPGRPAHVLELRANGVFVMDTAETRTEAALARAALAEVASPRRVLVGGLGLGFTVHEVLADHRVGHVTVAEVEGTLVRWFRDGTVPHGPAYLADRRLAVSVADVRQVVTEASPASYDLILLDVDNGPDFLVFPENARLYQVPFLRVARRALRPGGLLAVWSSAESERLTRAMRQTFGECETSYVPVTLQGTDDSYWLYSASRDDTNEE